MLDRSTRRSVAKLCLATNVQAPQPRLAEIAVFAGTSGRDLALKICEHLEISLGNLEIKRFQDGEVGLQFRDSIRGKDVYLIQSTSPPVNEHLVELLLMISALKRSSAKKITAVIPYFGYARQDRKMNSRVPISAADVALMIETMGADRVISVDLHSGQIQGFFRPAVPVDNLEAGVVGLEYFLNQNLFKPTIISPDAGGVYRARKFQESLARGAWGEKQGERPNEQRKIDRSSPHDEHIQPGPDRSDFRPVREVGLAMLIKQRTRANEIDRMDLVGDVKGCDVIVVDDIIDTAGTLCEAAAHLRRAGAGRIYAFATHGLFSGNAVDKIQQSVLEEVIVTDSILPKPEVRNSAKISILSITALLADVIRRIHGKESLEPLFTKDYLTLLPSSPSQTA